MNYELAKQLKDAGFPQRVFVYQHDGEKYLFRETDDDFPGNNRTMWARYYLESFLELHKDELVFVPTLSELIEACGDNLGDLTRVYEGWKCNSENVGGYPVTYGSTPEEAVAYLFLALNT